MPTNAHNNIVVFFTNIYNALFIRIYSFCMLSFVLQHAFVHKAAILLRAFVALHNLYFKPTSMQGY